jgi:hypothetical protein
VQPPAAPLRRPFAERPAHGLGEVGDKRPAEVAALGAFARNEALGSLALDRAKGAAPKALDGVLLAHDSVFGRRSGAVLPLKGKPNQSVEYFGCTFSPRMRAMALLAATAASPKPIVISVILPS